MLVFLNDSQYKYSTALKCDYITNAIRLPNSRLDLSEAVDFQTDNNSFVPWLIQGKGVHCRVFIAKLRQR